MTRYTLSVHYEDGRIGTVTSYMPTHDVRDFMKRGVWCDSIFVAPRSIRYIKIETSEEIA